MNPPKRELSIRPGRSGARFTVWVLFFVVSLAASGAVLGQAPAGEAAGSGASGGELRGQLFTAEHPDSVAGNAEVMLIWRDANDELNRISTTAGADGTYSFPGLAADPTIDYVVRVQFFGRDYLGAPVSFTAGETFLEYNFLVARDAESIPMDDIPEGHTQMGGAVPPPAMTPVQQNPVTMVVLVGLFLALFALPVLSVWKKEVSRAQGANRPPIDSLVRDIAGLDLRFQGGDLEEDVYRQVRESLFARLREAARGRARETA